MTLRPFSVLMDRLELIEKMRGRIALCRNLAALTGDPQTADALRQIANEGQCDLEKLEAEAERDL